MLSDISTSSRGDSEFEDDELLSNINFLLNAVGIHEKQANSMSELKRVASSMFVAIYEALFHITLDGIIRNPHNDSDYANNAQKVIDALGRRINKNLHHIRGDAIASGDILAISYLTDIFIHLATNELAQPWNHVEVTRKRNSGNFLGSKLASGRKSAGRTVSASSSLTNSPVTTPREKSKRKSLGYSSPYLSSPRVEKSISKQEFMDPSQFKTKSKELKQILKSHESLMKQNEKMENARRRREANYAKISSVCQSRNRVHREKVAKIVKDRFSMDHDTHIKASSLKEQSEEYAMLRKVYGGFLNKLRQWYWDEEHELREREEMQKSELMNQMNSLQNTFRDRMNIMKESSEEKLAEDRDKRADLRRYETTLKQLVKNEYERILERYQDQQSQFYQYQLSRRLEGYRHLAEMLKVEQWHDSLRCDSIFQRHL